MNYNIIILVFFLSGCVSGRVTGSFGSGKPNVSATIEVPVEAPNTNHIFSTAFGDIKRDATKEEVRYILGNPHEINEQRRITTWHYYLKDNKKIVVTFVDGNVTELKND
jgi:hypothetical protein